MDAEAARERCASLRRAGAELARLSLAEIVDALELACARWRDPRNADRRAGQASLAAHHRVAERAIATVLDAAFESWNATALRGWIESELGSPALLDRPIAIGGSRRMAFGPELVVAVSARGVPTTPIADVLAALMIKSPIWLKPAAGSDDLPARFAQTLTEVEPLLGAAVETAPWTRESASGAEIFAAADVVVATGRAETLVALQRVVSPHARLVVHGPRLSAALIGREAITGEHDRVIATLADDVAFAGQAGCLSPVLAWVEAPPHEVASWVEPLHEALVERWPAPPRSEGEPGERARFAEWLALAGVERAAGVSPATAGRFDTGWSVQARARAASPDPPPIPRLLVLAPIDAASDVIDLCARRRGTMATLGVVLEASRVDALAPALARAGVERVAPLGAMQRPPLAWRRDGRPTLADLVRWFDLEE